MPSALLQLQSQQSRTRRHGLTLLEVLIATAILAALAGAVVPSIARAMAALRPRVIASRVDLADLANVADRFIAKPELFSKDLTVLRLHEIESMQISWPMNESRFDKCASLPIDVHAIRNVDAGSDHLWVEFSCDGKSVIRWIAIPSKPEVAVHDGGAGGQQP